MECLGASRNRSGLSEPLQGVPSPCLAQAHIAVTTGADPILEMLSECCVTSDRSHPLSELPSFHSLGLGFLLYADGFYLVGAVPVSTSASGKARNAEFGMKLPEFIFNGGHTWTFLKRIRLSVAHL